MQLILQPAKLFGIQVGRSRDVERLFNVLYLDEAVRVVEFVPDKASKGSSNETVLFVLRRLNRLSHKSSTSNQVGYQSATNAQSKLQFMSAGCVVLSYMSYRLPSGMLGLPCRMFLPPNPESKLSFKETSDEI